MKYQVLVEGWGTRTYRGNTYKSIVTKYKATFKDKEKAIARGRQELREWSGTRLIVRELDPDKRFYTTTGRQTSSGVYYSGGHSSSDYTDRKIVYEEVDDERRKSKGRVGSL